MTSPYLFPIFVKVNINPTPNIMENTITIQPNPKIDLVTACFIVEGIEPSTYTQQVEAWAHLIKTGYAWRLQGAYGRAAQQLIEYGAIDRNGNINWELVEAEL